MSKTKVHAGNHFREIDGETADNLQGAINGELFEVTRMYPVYLNTAEFQMLTFFYAGVFIRAEGVIPRTVGRMKGIES